MNNHHHVGYKGKNRRIKDRRCYARRVMKHKFGSEKWEEAVQQSYAFWPKMDRRVKVRRCVIRRVAERWVYSKKHRRHSLRQLMFQNRFDEPLLTAEERDMLRELANRH